MATSLTPRELITIFAILHTLDFHPVTVEERASEMALAHADADHLTPDALAATIPAGDFVTTIGVVCGVNLDRSVPGMVIIDHDTELTFSITALRDDGRRFELYVNTDPMTFGED